jgi:hypothetical protein
MAHHHPVLHSSRAGCWCVCTCGHWRSPTFTTVSGAHLSFGKHLLVEAQRPAWQA